MVSRIVAVVLGDAIQCLNSWPCTSGKWVRIFAMVEIGMVDVFLEAVTIFKAVAQWSQWSLWVLVTEFESCLRWRES